MSKIKRQDLGKLGEQFVIVYAVADQVTIMPVIPKPTDVPGHRLDVPIDEKELFCIRKPSGQLHIPLRETKAVKPHQLTIIGKVSKAAMARIEQTLQRERQIRATEDAAMRPRSPAPSSAPTANAPSISLPASIVATTPRIAAKHTVATARGNV